MAKKHGPGDKGFFNERTADADQGTKFVATEVHEGLFVGSYVTGKTDKGKKFRRVDSQKLTFEPDKKNKKR
ncbi:hypothetical protein [Kineosporia sp. R_H_3]|uniref:hypothetical protein n=1 Tax=Kineosporia sp. R_H_3 TaxID=1961848 RepID=UPI000B4BB2D9|nr:hypothetical protein [Kineosporia sp. R_H_3]